MFSIEDNLTIKKTRILNSNIFEVFDVLKDVDWGLEYIEGRAHSTRFNINVIPESYKEFSLNIKDRHIAKLQKQLSLLCEQLPQEEGLFTVKYVKIDRKQSSFLQQKITHTNYMAVLYFCEYTPNVLNQSDNLKYNISLQSKANDFTHTIQTEHNKLILFDGSVFDLQHMFKTKDAKFNEYYMYLMYFN